VRAPQKAVCAFTAAVRAPQGAVRFPIIATCASKVAVRALETAVRILDAVECTPMKPYVPQPL
jgi:hypothetical protein